MTRGIVIGIVIGMFLFALVGAGVVVGIWYSTGKAPSLSVQDPSPTLVPKANGRQEKTSTNPSTSTPFTATTSIATPATLLGSISGTVTWQTTGTGGKTVVGIPVNLKDQSGKVLFSAITDAVGRYTIQGVQAGKYVLTAYQTNPGGANEQKAWLFEEVVINAEKSTQQDLAWGNRRTGPFPLKYFSERYTNSEYGFAIQRPEPWKTSIDSTLSSVTFSDIGSDSWASIAVSRIMNKQVFNYTIEITEKNYPGYVKVAAKQIIIPTLNCESSAASYRFPETQNPKRL